MYSTESMRGTIGGFENVKLSSFGFGKSNVPNLDASKSKLLSVDMFMTSSMCEVDVSVKLPQVPIPIISDGKIDMTIAESLEVEGQRAASSVNASLPTLHYLILENLYSELFNLQMVLSSNSLIG